MHGIIIAGGSGTRLHPLTKITNKHLLPIYDKQMIFYPLQTMIDAGITNITIVGSRGHVGQFLELLESGYNMGVNLSYVIQEKPLGIAHAIWVALREIGEKPVFVMLGDNITTYNFRIDVTNFKTGAKIFLKEVSNPKAYGVADIKGEEVVGIEEKPTIPKSNYAVIGAYMYDALAYDFIDKLKPSTRGEIEVTALNNLYIDMNLMDHTIIDGYWQDVGTFDGIYEATKFVRENK